MELVKIKRKLLGNFKQAYVDVLSRQQSACNARLLEAVQELTECCATLDHAVRVLLQRVAQLEGQGTEATASGGVYPRRDKPGGSPEDRRDKPGGSPATSVPVKEAHS